ncbi:MAG TPA: tetratricopeptide repeat protein [Fimbriimonadaceae bacterium]|nr:tetratricopeptide repeat protein [Fimbriimonadaceae bacterium]
MGDSTSRRRAVRLTEEALLLLKSRLNDEWDRLNLTGRLNREARAALMEVSVGTSERILNRKGNDRSVLQDVFKQLNLEWQDSFAEPMPNPSPSEVAPAPAPFPSPRARMPLVAAGFVLPALLAIWAFTRKPQIEDPLAMQLVEEGRKAYHEGKLEKADTILEKAIYRATSHRHESALAEGIRLQGEVYAATGDLEQAVECFKKSLVLREAFKFEWAYASVLEVLGAAETRLGRYGDAEAHLLEALKGLRETNDFRGAASTLRSLGVLYAAKGDPNRARRQFDLAELEMKRNPDQNLLVDMKAQRALLASAEGDHQSALLDLRQCLAHWERLSHRRWIATTQLQIAQVSARAGRSADALAMARIAKQNYEHVGDLFGVRQCNQILR